MRDITTWLKVMHRNLYVADHSIQTQNCNSSLLKCNIEHLVNCPNIKAKFWNHIIEPLKHTSLKHKYTNYSGTFKHKSPKKQQQF